MASGIGGRTGEGREEGITMEVWIQLCWLTECLGGRIGPFYLKEGTGGQTKGLVWPFVDF